MPRKLTPDFWLFGIVVVLCSVGVVMVYSASAIIATEKAYMRRPDLVAPSKLTGTPRATCRRRRESSAR